VMAQNRKKSKGMPIVNDFAAGIDIGSRFHVVAISPHFYEESVKTFQAFTSDPIKWRIG